MSFWRTALPVLLLVASAAGAAVGCGGLGVSSSESTYGAPGGGAADAVPSVAGEDGGVGGGPFTNPADAGAATLPKFLNNPLCAIPYSGTGTCDPQRDNTGDLNATTTHFCSSQLPKPDAGSGAPEPDAGGRDGGSYGGVSYACHVGRNPNGPGVAPLCVPEGTVTGTCTESSACTAAHECVGGTETPAQCRRYCCEPSACDGASFCDVQPIVASGGTMVPVCMPLAACDLLSSSTLQCPGQQCGTALDAKGLELRTCLDIGPRAVSEDCETDHCARGLTCLGAPGARKCFQLCDTLRGPGTGTHDCPRGQVCQASGPTFKGSSVGICGI